MNTYSIPENYKEIHKLVEEIVPSAEYTDKMRLVNYLMFLRENLIIERLIK